MNVAAAHYPRTRTNARVRCGVSVFMLVAAAIALGVCVAGCESPECVAGDLQGCRCGDGTYGYRTCALNGRYAPDAACDCLRGLTPDASRGD